MSSVSKLNIRKVFRLTHDPIWQLQLGVVAIIFLQFFTDDTFLPYNKFVIIIFEVFLMVVLGVVTSDAYHKVSRTRRFVALVLITLVAAINIFSLIFLLRALLLNHQAMEGVRLLQSGLTIYTTNIFIFALLYWEIDGGGPDRRVAKSRKPDFLFPQMIHRGVGEEGWLPGFLDYLYVSTTNVTNFASADTVPLSHRAKLLMMIQALVSVVIVVLVAARAIGVMQ